MRRRETLAITTLSLLALVRSIGVSLTEHHRGKKGYYDHTERTISMRTGLSDRAYRSTLAHELGHAYYSDELTGIEWIDERMEIRANRFAASLLVSPVEYAAAERLHGPHEDAIAHELGVTRKLLATWREQHERRTA